MTVCTKPTFWLAGKDQRPTFRYILAGMLSVSAVTLPAQASAQTTDPASEAASGASDVENALTGILLLGSTALPVAQVAASAEPFIGKPVTPELLQQIRLAVSALHEDAGFALVSVDVPVMRGTTALIRVQQLRLAAVEAVPPSKEGATGQAAAALQARAKAALPALRAGETPNLKMLDRQLRLANLQPHRRLSVDFRGLDADGSTTALAPNAADLTPARVPLGPSPANAQGRPMASAKDIPAAVPITRLPGYSETQDRASMLNARILVSDGGPFYGRVLLDNAGQPSVGRQRLRLQLGHGDLLGPGRSVDVTTLVSVTHPERQHQFALRYQHPLPALGTLLSAEASISRSRPGIVNEFFDVSGNSKIASVSARHLLPRSGTLEPYIEAGFELAEHDDVVNFFGVNLGSKVGTAPVSVTLAATWQDSRSNAFAQIRGRHNIGVGGVNSAGRYSAARFSATPDWTTIDAFAVFRSATGKGQEFALRAQGQWSPDALIAPQQFRAGGQNFMRGLIESEMAGDSGAAMAVEYWGTLAPGHRLAGFIDGAIARRNNALANETGTLAALSAGLAWQWTITRGVQLNVAAARVMTTRNLPQSQAGDTQLHVLLEWAL